MALALDVPRALRALLDVQGVARALEKVLESALLLPRARLGIRLWNPCTHLGSRHNLQTDTPTSHLELKTTSFYSERLPPSSQLLDSSLYCRGAVAISLTTGKALTGIALPEHGHTLQARATLGGTPERHGEKPQKQHGGGVGTQSRMSWFQDVPTGVFRCLLKRFEDHLEPSAAALTSRNGSDPGLCQGYSQEIQASNPQLSLGALNTSQQERLASHPALSLQS